MEPIMSDQATAFSLVGETALVTGATRGIGREAALALARAGANVAAGCRDRDAGEGLAAEIRALGVRGAAVSMDLTDFASIPAAVDAAEAALGPLSILVNNAGHSRPAPSLDVGIADFDAMFDLNVKGAFFAAQAVARRMVPRRHGTVINVASQAGLVALPGESVYCMTKAAMIHMTRCLAVEWAPHQIRVNAVAPTFTRTDSTRRWFEDPVFLDSLLARIPLGRVGEPRNVADPIVFLASQAAAMITGATLAIDGGWTAV
jgi:NAD(P)-dependent dehydrogenase (short-subunit alcohol dehydrogenase family)